MEEKKRTKAIRNGLVIAFIAILLVTSIAIQNPMTEEKVTAKERKWNVVAEANPGAGASGILEVYIYPHDGDPGTTYAENTSATLEASAYCYATADNSEIDPPHSTTFDILVRVRANKTHAWNTSGGVFWGEWVRVNVTSSDLSISETTLTNVESRNDTSEDYIWINAYLNNGGSGYTIDRDERAEISSIKLEAYY